MRRFALALLVVLSAVLGVGLGAGGTAQADTADTVLVSGYVLGIGFAGVATAVNGASLAYDQPSTRGWRILGMAVGGLDLAAGTALLIGKNDRSEGIVLGSLACAFGAASLVTGYFAAEDVRVGVIRVAGGGLLTVAGRF